jgi:hypothetical protein
MCYPIGPHQNTSLKIKLLRISKVQLQSIKPQQQFGEGERAVRLIGLKPMKPILWGAEIILRIL